MSQQARRSTTGGDSLARRTSPRRRTTSSTSRRISASSTTSRRRASTATSTRRQQSSSSTASAAASIRNNRYNQNNTGGTNEEEKDDEAEPMPEPPRRRPSTATVREPTAVPETWEQLQSPAPVAAPAAQTEASTNVPPPEDLPRDNDGNDRGSPQASGVANNPDAEAAAAPSASDNSTVRRIRSDINPTDRSCILQYVKELYGFLKMPKDDAAIDLGVYWVQTQTTEINRPVVEFRQKYKVTRMHLFLFFNCSYIFPQ